MDKDLYVERWLLTVKSAALAAGLAAHVRALDGKGGRLLALEMSKDSDALEVRYRKRRRGPHIVAAATGAGIVGLACQIFEELIAEHGKLLENAFRRFLRLSLELLNELAKALAKDSAAVKDHVLAALGTTQAGARSAVVVHPGKDGRWQVYPAVARPQGNSFSFWAWNHGQFLDLSNLFPGERGSGVALAPGQSLPALGASAALSIGSASELSFPTLPSTGAASPAAKAASGSAGRAGALGVVGELLDFTTTAMVTDGTVEVVAQAASCLGDAACSGIDLGGLDCNL